MEGEAGDQATPLDRGRGEAVFWATMAEAMGRGEGARMALGLGVESSTVNEEEAVSMLSGAFVSERERKCFRNPWRVRQHRGGHTSTLVRLISWPHILLEQPLFPLTFLALTHNSIPYLANMPLQHQLLFLLTMTPIHLLVPTPTPS